VVCGLVWYVTNTGREKNNDRENGKVRGSNVEMNSWIITIVGTKQQ